MTRSPGLSWLPALVVLATLGKIAASADVPRLVVTPLLRTQPSGEPGLEAVIAHGEFPPGASTGRHTHPGDEYAYVLEGTLELLVDGREPRRVAAGEAYHNPRGVVHETRNAGEGIARVASTFVVDRGAPLLQPAP